MSVTLTTNGKASKSKASKGTPTNPSTLAELTGTVEPGSDATQLLTHDDVTIASAPTPPETVKPDRSTDVYWLGRIAASAAVMATIVADKLVATLGFGRDVDGLVGVYLSGPAKTATRTKGEAFKSAELTLMAGGADPADYPADKCRRMFGVHVLISRFKTTDPATDPTNVDIAIKPIVPTGVYLALTSLMSMDSAGRIAWDDMLTVDGRNGLIRVVRDLPDGTTETESLTPKAFAQECVRDNWTADRIRDVIRASKDAIRPASQHALETRFREGLDRLLSKTFGKGHKYTNPDKMLALLQRIEVIPIDADSE